jgi:hypothetical protein
MEAPAAGPEATPTASRGVRLVAVVLLGVVAPIAFLALVEGAASLLLLGRDLIGTPKPERAENRHTMHDTLLGWVNRPHVELPDMYGPGLSLRTNDRGFRGRDTVPSREDARGLLVCSGDSFTLGFGVSDEQTWCALLARATGRQVANMGQGGYGVDQAWLWYRRDGMALPHDVHVLAFITDDFRRMGVTSFLGYPKSRLRAPEGTDSIALENVPVPRPGLGVIVNRYRPVLSSSRLWQLTERLTRRLDGARGASPGDALPEEEVQRVFARIVADLARANRQKGSMLLLVYFPLRIDATTDMSGRWRERVRVTADSLGVPFVDIVEALRAVPAAERDSLYLQPGELSFVRAAGHFSVRGNRWVADQLRERLLAMQAASDSSRAARAIPPGRSGEVTPLRSEGPAPRSPPAPGGRAPPSAWRPSGG